MARNTRASTALIVSGASLSSIVWMPEHALVAIQIPSAWTAAAITFQGSTDGSTFGDLYDDGGTEVTIASATVAASRTIVNGSILEKLAPLVAFKVRSGTTGTPVNQAADRSIAISVKE